MRSNDTVFVLKPALPVGMKFPVGTIRDSKDSESGARTHDEERWRQDIFVRSICMDVCLLPKRLPLVEIEDTSWCPTLLRTLSMDYLAKVVEVLDVYAPVKRRLQSILSTSQTNRIFDLCSGSGGPWRQLARSAELGGFSFKLTFSDLYPQLDQMRSFPTASYVPTPFNAATDKVPHGELVTMFNAAHHFRNEQLKTLLTNATENGASILFCEVTQRRFISLCMVLLTPLLVFAITPFIRPFSFTRLLLTYVVPVVPLFATYDGVVSVLRSFTEGDLRALANTVREGSYVWKVSSERALWFLPPVLILEGTRR